MLFAGLPPPPSGYSPALYRRYIEDSIRPCVDTQLFCEDFAILFSGPSKFLKNTSGIPDIKSNKILSAEMKLDIQRTEGIFSSRLGDTEAAKALEKHDLKTYFDEYFKKEFPSANKDEIDDLANAAYFEVWSGPSAMFAERDFHHAATAVCGADSLRVFVKEEIPVLVNTNHLQTINGITFEPVRIIYNEVRPDEAFRLVCLSEINFVYSRAHTSKLGAAHVLSDAKQRIAYFDFERNDTERLLDKLTRAQKQDVQSIASEFELEAFYATAPKTWGCEVKRPLQISTLVTKKPNP